MFNLTAVVKRESLFGGFIWSHIKLQDLKRFIDVANSLVKAGGTIVFMDNNYVEGSNLPLTEKDDSGNTYHTRTLEDGTTHKVLKNFPSEAAIREVLTGRASEIDFIQLQYYWILKYQNL
jgi:demethylmenaquinone methyltransferase/2-methoxy-6-polyprenyl-1,4-benzoquinol methylase